nr:hypothetical protein [Brevundimonas diminuta]
MKNALVALATLPLAACQFIPGQPEYEIAQAQKHVAADLADPESAKFRSVNKINTTVNGEKKFSICGEINAKNTLGAYTGYRRFVHRPGQSIIDPGVDDADLKYVDRCLQAEYRQRVSPSQLNSMKAKSYCERIDEMKAHIDAFVDFNEFWTNNCGG